MTVEQNSKPVFDAGVALFQMIERAHRQPGTRDSNCGEEENLFDPSCFVSRSTIDSRYNNILSMSGDDYNQQVLVVAENAKRKGVIDAINDLAESVLREEKSGALYVAEITLLSSGSLVTVGVVAQNKNIANGVWGPAQHKKVVSWVKSFESKNLPIITFIDTPGADASSDANKKNQAHSISELIATMAGLSVPTVGIIWGVGYSGGAIPLATTNLLLSVTDGVFNTIQPKGLASIARKQQLDWQTCARIVGISAIELHHDELVDGIIDYSPLDAKANISQLKEAICHSISLIEKRATDLVASESPLMSYYHQRSLDHAISSDNKALYQYPSVFGLGFKVARSQKLRARLSLGGEQKEKESAQLDLPMPSKNNQVQERSRRRFEQWYENSDRLIYEDSLNHSWTQFKDAEINKEKDRNYLSTLVFGNPQDNYERAKLEVLAEISFYIFNRWQQESAHHIGLLLPLLNAKLEEETVDKNTPSKEPSTVLDIVFDARFTASVSAHSQHLMQFEKLYETILSQLPEIVSELSLDKRVSGQTIDKLLDDSGLNKPESQEQFSLWLTNMCAANNFSLFLRTVEQWKKVQHPRLSDVMFVVVSFFFEKLMPSYFESKKDSKRFLGNFTPVSIGRRKDFWNRLLHATRDMRIQTILNEIKPAKMFTPDELVSNVFEDFAELDADLMCRDPKSFPGFSDSINRQVLNSNRSSGLITGIGMFHLAATAEKETNSEERVESEKHGAIDSHTSVGVFISNHSFQAGAFDTSSAEKLCRLLAYCAEYSMPVVGFISSGGMQTKEGPASLFSMPVVNDKINWFAGELGLPILMFGYGDCTGGAQASLVTHPLVDTYYFSGTNMPFAGRIVVPDYLPVTATLSNYLIETPGCMQGLAKHPFVDDLDERLKKIDPKIVSATSTVTELVGQWLTNQDLLLEPLNSSQEVVAKQKFEAYETVLIHARGCTAVKLIREAQAMGLNVVLVQSDPDMDSVAAEMLGENDHLVCIGGYTSDESYLNGNSVLRVAELYHAQAIHPGIGFLSENHQFAHQCLEQGLNFIGPSPQSMEMMGDKARAIHTAISNGVPVVPGSHGIVPNIKTAKAIAEEIGYPIILKAVHGGGGKGILVVEHEIDLADCFSRIQAEAKSSFGSDAVYLERLITRFRHIEVQLLRDRYGCTKIIGIRDCSVQRNKQKIVEESFSTALTQEQYDIAVSSTEKLANACDYHGAGTVEFIYDLDQQSLYFMEMNTRLQVEHPVTEKVSGVDIVKEQYRIAMGDSIENLSIENKGYSLEVRINAERVRVVDSELLVTPCPGLVTECDFPEEEGIDNIVMIGAGKSIPPFYDNLVAQVIAHGETREDTLKFMLSYLSKVNIKGVDTNIELLKLVLVDEVFNSGDYDTTYLVDLTQREAQAMSVSLVSAESDAGLDFERSINIEGSEELKVFAPTTSIVYHSASPEQPAYVKEGDTISVDQTLCLLEVMKMFQPLNLKNFNKSGESLYPSNQQYRVMHVKGADGQQVNQGDLLFVIKPVVEEA